MTFVCYDTFSSPSQINLEYRQGVKKFVLTPSRKHVGRAVARRSRSALVAEVLRDPIAKQYLIKRIGGIIRKELVLMCSDKTNSILGSQLVCDLKEFTWDKLFEELSFNAPILLSILRDCTQTRRPRTNRSAVIGMCFAILLKYRYLKVNLIQKIISMILYAGDSTKQVIYYICNVCSIVSQMC